MSAASHALIYIVITFDVLLNLICIGLIGLLAPESLLALLDPNALMTQPAPTITTSYIRSRGGLMVAMAYLILRTLYGGNTLIIAETLLLLSVSDLIVLSVSLASLIGDGLSVPATLIAVSVYTVLMTVVHITLLVKERRATCVKRKDESSEDSDEMTDDESQSDSVR